MIKSIAIKALIIASFIWVALIDMVVMVAVFSMVARIALVFGTSDTFSFIAGMIGAIATFAHLKFRHRMRCFGSSTPSCICCGGSDDCKEICEPCLEIASGGEIEEYGTEDTTTETTTNQGETK